MSNRFTTTQNIIKFTTVKNKIVFTVEKNVVEFGPVYHVIAQQILPEEYVAMEQLQGTINNINKTFTTLHNIHAGSSAVFINGIKQRLNIDYTEFGNSIIFDEAPNTSGFNDDLYIIYKRT